MKTNILSKAFRTSALICLILLNLGVNGQVVGDYRTKGTGAFNWGVAANWERCITDGDWTGATSDTYPGEDANAGTVTILDGAVVTLNVALINPIEALAFEDASANATSLTITGQPLEITGAITFGNPSANGGDQTLSIGTGILNCASINMPDTGADGEDLLISVSTGTLTVTGSILMNGSSSRNNITFSSSGTLNVGSDFNGGGFTCSTGTVNYNGTGAQNVGNYTYNNLVLTNNSIKTLQDDATVGGNLTVNADATYSLGATATAFSVTGTATIEGTFDFGDTSTKTVDIIGNLSGAGTIDMSGSTLLHTLNLGGATNAIGTLTTAAVASTINYNRGNIQTVFASPNYRNLTISGSNTKTLQGEVTVNNDLDVSAGTFDLGATATSVNISGNADIGGTITFGTTTKTVNVTGNLSGAGTIDMSTSSNNIINLAGNNTTSGTFTAGTSTFNYNGTNQTVRASSINPYNNLILSNSGIKTLTNIPTLTINGSLEVNGPLTILAFRSSSAQTVTIVGNLSGDGTIDMSPGTNLAHILNLGGANNSIGTLSTDPTGSTVNYNRTGAQTVFGSLNYRNLTFSNGNTKTLQGNISVGGTLTLTSGLVLLGDYDFTITNGATISGGSVTAMVITDGTGELKKVFPSGDPAAFTFPLGDITGSNDYSTVVLDFSANNTERTIGVKVTDAQHPNDGTATDYISRYWSFTDDQAGTYTYTALFNHSSVAPADLVGTNGSMHVNRWNGSSWTQYTSTWPSGTSFQATDLNQSTALLNNSSFTGRVNTATYTWNQTDASGDWQVAANWTPSRLSVQPSDILVFDNNGTTTATNVPTETLAKLTVSGNTNLSLVSTGAKTLTISSSSGTSLNIESGSNLQLSSSLGNQILIAFTGTQTATIAGTLTLNANTATNNTYNATNSITTVSGTIINNGGAITSTSSNLIFDAAGTYRHAINGGAIPSANWNTASTCEITGTTSTIPTGITQTFGNLTWNCASQSAALSLNNSLTVNGTFRVQTTNNQTLRLTGNATNRTITATNYMQDAGVFELSNQASNWGLLNVSGTFIQNGGTITKSNNNASNEIRFSGASDASIILSGTINSTGTNPLVFNANKTAANVILPVNPMFDASVQLRVTTGTLDFGTTSSTVTVNGPFSILAGGTIDMSGDSDHIFDLAGTVTYAAGSSFISGNNNQEVRYSVGAQDVMPFTYRNLTLSATSSTKTLLGAVTVNNNLSILNSATLYTNTYQITGNASGVLTMASGTTLQLGNTGSATNVLFPSGYTSGNIILHANSTVIYRNNATQTISGEPTYGNLTIATGGTKTFNDAAATFNIAGDLSISAGTLSFGTTTKTVSVNGNLSGTGTISMTGMGLAHSLNLTGVTNTISTFTTTDGSGSTVSYNLNGAQTAFASANYQNLTLSGSGAKTTTGITVKGVLSMEGTATASVAPTYGTAATLQYNTATNRAAGVEWVTPFAASGGVIVANTGVITLNAAKVFNAGVPLTINSGASLNTSAANNYALTLGGNFVNSGGTFTANASNITIADVMVTQSIASFTTTGAVAMTKTGGTATFQGNVNGGNFTINGAGGTLNLGAGLSHYFTGTWTRAAGTLNGGSSTLFIEGSVSGSGGTYTAGTGTVDYYATGAQTIAGVTYNNLTLSDTGTKTAGGSITVNGDLTIAVGSTLDMGTANILSGSLSTITNNGTIKTSVPTATSNTPIPTGLTWNGSLEYSAPTGSQTIVSGTYGNLTLGNTSGTSTAGGVITVNGTFSSTLGGTFATNTDVTFSGTTLCGGGSINAAAGTVTYGSTAINIISGTYNNIVIPDNATLCGNITVNGLITLGINLDYNGYSISGLPVVSSVSSSEISGTYKIGSIINITVLFNKVVTVLGGPPQITLETGTTDRTVNYTTGSGTNTLTFPYTVQLGDVSSDLDYVASSLVLNGGTIKDASGNNVSLNLPTPGDANSLGANKDFVVDGIVPTLTYVHIQSNNPTNTLAKEGNVITLTFTGSETLTSKPNVTIATHTIDAGDITNTGGNTWTATYIMAIGDATGNVPFTINFSDIAGNAGTQVTTVTDASSVTFDKTIPTISNVGIQSNNPTNTLAKVGDIVTLSFTGSEVLTAKPTVTIAAHNILAGSITNTVGNTWTTTYQLIAGDSEGEVPFTINFSDLAGNNGSEVSAITTGSNVTFDKTKPTVTISSNKTHTNNNPITLTITFNENVMDFVATDVNVTNGTRGALTETTPMRVWTLVVTPNGSGNIQCSISANACTDLAGNDNLASNSINVVYDIIAPDLNTVTIASNNTYPAYVGVGGKVTISIIASESILLVSGDVSIAGHTAGVTLSGSGVSWFAEYTMLITDTEGPVSFSINFVDLAGNAGTMIVATTNSSSVLFDISKPVLNVVSIASSNVFNSSLATVGDLITVSFTAGEKIEAVTATIKGKTAIVTNTDVDANEWEATYTMSSGDLDVPSNVNFVLNFKDYAGNTGLSVSSTTAPVTSVTFDKSKPTLSGVSITSSNAIMPSRAGSGHTITVTFTANEVIQTPSVAILGHAATVSNIAGNQWKGDYVLDGSEPEGQVSFSINFSDAAGNQGISVSTVNDGSTVTVDKTIPILTSISIASNNANSSRAIVGNTITLSFNSNETIQAPTVTISGQPAIVINTSGNSWTATYTLLTGDSEGVVAFAISFQDMVSNSGTIVTTTLNGSLVIFDKSAPTLTTVGISSNNPSPYRARVGNIVTVAFTSSEAILLPTATIFGRAATIENVSGNQWTALATALDTDPEGEILFSINFADIAGNNGVSVTATTNASILFFDRTNPLLTAVNISSNHSNSNFARVGSTVSLMINANESLSNITTAINGMPVTPISLGGDNWVCNYIPSTSDLAGTIPFTINFVDLAGNIGAPVTATTNSSQVYFDKTKPSFSSITISTTDPFSPYVKNGSLVELSFTTDEPTENPSVRINNDFATSITGGPTNWVASRTLGAAEPPTNVFFEIFTNDMAGNESFIATTTTNGSYLVFDNTPPAISLVTVTSGVYKVGNIIPVFIQADYNNYVGTIVEVNGKTQTLINNNNNTYIINYTVAENDNQINALANLPVNIILQDGSGNITTLSSAAANGGGGTITIDSHTPQIASVTSNAEVDGILKIGDQLTFSVTPAVSETGLIITPTTYNGKPITWTTATGTTYTATYTVAEGDATQDPALQIGTIGIADIAGNTGTPNDYTGVLKTIYATKPTATILGTISKCDYGQTVPVSFHLTGHKPFQLTYNNGTANVGPIPVDAYTYNIDVLSGTYTLVSLVDSTGNVTNAALQNAVITVNALPNVTLNIVGSPFNDDAEPIYLFNFATPNSGGVFSGDGVTSNGYFHPRFFDVSGGDVFVTITYTYTNSNGCINSASNEVVVSSGGATINGLNSDYCNYDEPFTITATNPLVPTVYGDFVISTASTGWIDNGNNSITINPSLIGAKTHLIKYSYWDGATEFIVTRSFIIDSVGVNVDFLTLNNQYCKSANSVQLNAVSLYPSLGTGHFFGPTTGFSTVENSNSAIFTPEFAPLDQPLEISYYYLSPLGCSSDTIIKPTIVYSLPIVDVAVNHNYNYDGPPVQLVGNHADGLFYLGTTAIANGILYPNLFAPNNYSITYTYTDPTTTCVNSVSKPTRILKATDIIGLEASYCYSDDEVNISCDPVFDTSIEGTFSSNNGGIIPTGIVNKAKYSIAAAGNGVDTVFFRYNIEGTPYEVFKRVFIDSIGQATITGLQPNYCNDLGQQILVGSNNNNIGFGFGKFSYNGNPLAFGDLGTSAFITPLLEVPGSYIITYKYQSSQTNCFSQVDSTITINPVPNVLFSILQSCTGIAVPVQFINNTTSTDEITSWYWTFTGEPSSTDFAPNFNFQSTGEKEVSLRATTINGCSTEKVETITVGIVPQAKFAWENECLTDQATVLKCTATETNILNYQWVFDDGTINEGATLNSVNHLFDAEGFHEVKLVLTSTDNCKDSLTKAIYIQPLIKFNELPNNVYSQNFEAGEAHWLARSLTSNNYLSWEFGKPNGDIIFEAASDENAWFTAVNYPSTQAERSEVVSPCFNFSNLEKPMLKLNIWSSPETGRDGAVLQYSTNQGLTWEILGEANKGINWFNSTTIQSQPGGSGQFDGWSGIPMTSWQSARYKLDDVKGQPNVRFRIVYAAGGGAINYIDGFAFDDFWIGNRTQSVMLEYFTNVNITDEDVNITAANFNMASIDTLYSSDVIPANYHTSTPSGDPVSALFPYSSSGREFFYGLSTIPYALANGTAPFNFTSSDSLTFMNNNQNIIEVESLQDPKMLLDISYTDDSDVEIVANVTSLIEIDSEDLLLFCAIVQPIVNISTGETYYNVVREFLPNSAGISLQRSWVANESKSFTFTYNPSPDDIANGTRIVVMVQNVATRKVYQSKSIELTLTAKPVSSSSVISTNIFPNPAKHNVTVEGSEDIMTVSIIDLSGRTVSTTKVNGRQTTIPVEGLSNGVYFMQIDFKNQRTVRKFVKQ